MTESESIQSCLQMITDLRSQTSAALKTASDGAVAKHGSDVDGKEKKYLSELKLQNDNINSQIKDLEAKANAQTAGSSMFPLGHSVYLNLDTASESASLYNSLAGSYKWLDRTHEYAGTALSVLSQNNLIRTHGKVTKKIPKRSTCHTPCPKQVDELIAEKERQFPDMQFQILRPNGTALNSIVHVTLGRILKCVIVFKGMMIEWVSVKGYNEDYWTSEEDLDVWSESDYHVFKRITYNANAAMLNFQSTAFPHLAVRSFLTYLHSYGTLFKDKCKNCGYHLRHNLPPTWREYKTLEPYHEDCKP